MGVKYLTCFLVCEMEVGFISLDHTLGANFFTVVNDCGLEVCIFAVGKFHTWGVNFLIVLKGSGLKACIFCELGLPVSHPRCEIFPQCVMSSVWNNLFKVLTILYVSLLYVWIVSFTLYNHYLIPLGDKVLDTFCVGDLAF